MIELDADIAAAVATLNEAGLMDWAGLDAEGVRAKFANVKQTVREPHIARVEQIELDGPAGVIPCRLYHPKPAASLPLLVWCHGGGWVLGTLDSEEGTCRFLAQAGSMAVLSVDYRLAPEHPFPAAFVDAAAAFDWACVNGSRLGTNGTAIGGASAGGNLAAAVSIARAGGSVSPAAQLLVYPILDCDMDRESMHRYADGLVLHRTHMQWFWDQYVPDPSQRCDPRAAPLHADVPASLAPVTLLLAQCDPLVDEGRAFARALEGAGVSLRCVEAQGMTHGFLGMSRSVPAARDLLQREIQRFAAPLHDSA